MRRIIVLVSGVLIILGTSALQARAEEQKRSERVLTGVISGLLGAPAQSPDAAYTAQERDRLAQLLQSGDYATSRQGEPVDMVVYGIPLTQAAHVYTAKPIPSSKTSYQQPAQ